MKKNFLWLLLFIPAIFIAASSPIANDNYLGNLPSGNCSSSGDVMNLLMVTSVVHILMILVHL